MARYASVSPPGMRPTVLEVERVINDVLDDLEANNFDPTNREFQKKVNAVATGTGQFRSFTEATIAIGFYERLTCT